VSRLRKLQGTTTASLWVRSGYIDCAAKGQAHQRQRASMRAACLLVRFEEQSKRLQRRGCCERLEESRPVCTAEGRVELTLAELKSHLRCVDASLVHLPQSSLSSVCLLEPSANLLEPRAMCSQC
jgi:hypothetical protein